MIHKILGWVAAAMRTLCAVMVAAILIINLLAVFMRYVFAQPLFWCEEVSLLLFAWCIACALIPLTYKRGGVSLDFFVDMLPETPRKILGVVVNVLGAALLTTVSVFGIQLMQRSVYRFTPMLMISYRYIYLSMVVGMAVSAVILLVYAADDTLALLRGRKEARPC